MNVLSKIEFILFFILYYIIDMTNNTERLTELNCEYATTKIYADIFGKARDVFKFATNAAFAVAGGVSLSTIAITSYTLINSNPNALNYHDLIHVFSRLQNTVNYGGLLSIGFIVCGFTMRYVSGKFNDYACSAHFKIDRLIEKASELGA